MIDKQKILKFFEICIENNALNCYINGVEVQLYTDSIDGKRVLRQASIRGVLPGEEVDFLVRRGIDLLIEKACL